MAQKWQLYDKFHQALGKRILSHNHRGRRVEKLYKVASHISNGRVHIGELCLALLFLGSSYLFGNGDNVPNNTTLVYPLYKVSTLDCRTQPFSELSDSCKIQLPLIRGADYTTYQNAETYMDIYTVLWGASYTHQRNQSVGAHYAVDIATAKGTPLYAIADGEVYSAEYNTAYGNVVKIKFKYKGEILYAVYAHMNKYNVKAGDTVRKGQQIGEVGNSGNTSGELGGNHVHFEIDKDNGGRPAYAFTNCEDVSKGHYTIIQQGLCRVQLVQYTKDPIVLLEGAKATYPVDVQPSEPSQPSQPTEPTQPVQPVQPPVEPDHSAPSEPVTPNTPTNEGGQVALTFDKVDAVGKEFLKKREIVLEKDFGEILALNNEVTLTIKIKDKTTGEGFHGTLSQPLLMVANNTNINLKPVSTVLITHGEAKITLTPKKAGNVYLAINLGTVKIGGITMSIQ